MIGILPKDAMPSGRVGVRLWEGPQACEGRPGYIIAQTGHRHRARELPDSSDDREGGPREERPQEASRPWWDGAVPGVFIQMRLVSQSHQYCISESPHPCEFEWRGGRTVSQKYIY